MLTYLAGPSPRPSAGTTPPTDRTGLVVLAVLVVLGVFGVVYLRRAAARYRKRLREQDEG